MEFNIKRENYDKAKIILTFNSDSSLGGIKGKSMWLRKGFAGPRCQFW